jgi:uncharacterized membrane protein YfcA
MPKETRAGRARWLAGILPSTTAAVLTASWTGHFDSQNMRWMAGCLVIAMGVVPLFQKAISQASDTRWRGFPSRVSAALFSLGWVLQGIGILLYDQFLAGVRVGVVFAVIAVLLMLYALFGRRSDSLLVARTTKRASTHVARP